VTTAAVTSAAGWGQQSWRPYPPQPARRNCTVCRGTGWRVSDVTGRNLASRCFCVRLKRRLLLRDGVRVPERYESCTLDRFVPASESQFEALAEAQRFVRKFPAPTRSLLFAGSSGVGKTHLAVGIILELLVHYQDSLLFVDVETLMRRPEEAAGSPDEFSVWERLEETALLVMDGIQEARPENARATRVESLIQRRRQTAKPLIVTETIHRHPGPFGRVRIARSPMGELLRGIKIVRLDGPDYRNSGGRASSLFGPTD